MSREENVAGARKKPRSNPEEPSPGEIQSLKERIVSWMAASNVQGEILSCCQVLSRNKSEHMLRIINRICFFQN